MVVKSVRPWPSPHMADSYDEVYMENEYGMSYTYLTLNTHELRVGMLVSVEFSAAVKEVRQIDS